MIGGLMMTPTDRSRTLLAWALFGVGVALTLAVVWAMGEVR